jgi:hypothetical protein
MNRPIAIEAAAGAKRNIGVVEHGGENRGVAVETYLRSVGLPPGLPWCAAFVRFRFERAAAKLDVKLPEHFPDSGWVPAYVEWAKTRDVWLTPMEALANFDQVRPGDLVAYWFEHKNRCAHIGIVVEPATTAGFTTVEGNTNGDDPTTVERDGDGVWLKRRRWTSLGPGGGIIRINW